MHFEKQKTSQRIYEGKIVNLRKDEVILENGDTAFREVVEHPGGVAVLAVDETGEAFFVEQYRYAAGQTLLELPAGKLEPGEDPMQAAARELEEECGVAAKSLTPLAKMIPTCAFCTEVIHIFLATGLIKTKQNLDADEFLTVKKMPVEKARELVLHGEIPDAKTQLGVLKYTALLDDK